MMHNIDMHCDTVMKAILTEWRGGEKGDLFRMPRKSDFEGMTPEEIKADPRRGGCTIDVERLAKAETMAQCFGVFLMSEPGKVRSGFDMPDLEYIDRATALVNKVCSEHSDVVAHAYNAEDIKKNFAAKKVSAILSMEDGRAVQGDLNMIKKFYDDGYRMLALIWNYENCFGYPNSKESIPMAKGLKPFGKEAVQYMQELGMIVDVSHLSFGGFDDIIDICKKPFVASHSNAAGLSPHQRNLDDRRLKKLADHGGITGLNFEGNFLNEDITNGHSTAAMIAKHARYIANVAGIDTVAIGTDSDGIGPDVEIDSCDKMYLLEDALKKEGFSEAEIDKISFGNALRVFGEAMK